MRTKRRYNFSIFFPSFFLSCIGPISSALTNPGPPCSKRSLVEYDSFSVLLKGKSEKSISDPGFPFGHYLLIDQDLAILDLIGNGVGRILETAPFDPTQSFYIPFCKACIAYNGLIS